MRKIFHTVDTTLEQFDGEEVEVLRKLTKEEADLDDVGMMYKIQFVKNGFLTDAFEDELSEVV